MNSNISKYYTIKKSDACISGYGIYECIEDKCKLIACTVPSPLSTAIDLTFYTKFTKY
ncbi:hypothetical protein KN1_16390 [Stygiolobus caldivivus]|uniref:Uncharacterized protein n=1 Tax=Stygiolobus caldivivus TaxID=2824673 RepID=A0A8D5U7D1_9CREN|nr:hypothetical protein KN1_16390 [Stygiolobus caldivivus]